jgi:hypothetical protein
MRSFAVRRQPDLRQRNQFGIILVMPASKRSAAALGAMARTIRFSPRLRDRISADAERCGRSFEGQVIAILRRHYGEDVDIAPSADAILALAHGSLEGMTSAERRLVTQRLRERGS